MDEHATSFLMGYDGFDVSFSGAEDCGCFAAVHGVCVCVSRRVRPLDTSSELSHSMRTYPQLCLSQPNGNIKTTPPP